MKLLDKKSLLSHTSLEMDEKRVFLVDGIRYSAKIIEQSFESLKKNLLEIALQKNSSGGGGDERSGHLETVQYSAFQNAWTIIDFSHKMRNMLVGMNTRFLPAVEEFFANVRNLRNTFQHMDERVDNFMESTIRYLWGTLKWIYVIDHKIVRTCVIASGHLRSSNIEVVNPLHVELDTEICGIILCSVNRKSQLIQVHFNKHMKALKSVLTQLEDQLALQFPIETRRHVADLFISVDLELTFTQKKN